MQTVLLLLWILPGLVAITAHADELKPETAAAFERYIGVTEARMDNDIRLNQFLVVDRLPDSRRQEAYDQLHRNQTYIEELHVAEDHRPFPIPNGQIHHLAGVIFIPHATLSETIAVIEDYDNETNIYKPEIRRSKLVEHNGNESKIYLQFVDKSIVTVVLNVYFDVSDTRFGNTQRQAASRSTRIAEVANPGSVNEYERRDGNDHGYLWRFNNYWRIEEKDGGVYVQNESVTLSRTFPEIIAWLINPLIKNISRDILLDLLTDTRKAVMGAVTISK
jgi:hypothetical protein